MLGFPVMSGADTFNANGLRQTDMPHDTDYPYPIRILAVFFLADTAVLRYDTDFNKIYGVINFNHIMGCMRHNTILHNGIIVYC